jgi:hypothetical protein
MTLCCSEIEKCIAHTEHYQLIVRLGTRISLQEFFFSETSPLYINWK